MIHPLLFTVFKKFSRYLILILTGIFFNVSGGFLDKAEAQQLVTSCPNSNFNLGTFQDWIGCYGTFFITGGPEPHVVLQPCNTPGFAQNWPNPGRRHIIMHSPATIDPYSCGTLQTVFPGEQFVARLGDTAHGGHAEQLKYDIFVDTNKYLFVYRYAVVLESPNHNYNEQPGFSVTVTDTNGLIFDSTCGFYQVYAPTVPNNPPPGWIFCNVPGTSGIYVKNWTTVGLNLTPYFGQTIRIVFTTHGCCYSAHRGYAYISAYCSKISLHTAMCEGDSSATLIGPPGFGYYWFTLDGDTTVNGDTTQSITVPNPVTGSTYSCTLTAVNGCQVTISQTLTYTVIHSNFTHGSACNGVPVQFTDSSYVNQNYVENWKWDFGDATPTVLGNPNPQHTFTLPGIYLVKLVSYSTEGCKDSITKPIVVDSLPVITSNPLNKLICSKDSTNLGLTANLSGTLYTWTATCSNPLLTGYTQNPGPGAPDINDVLINMANSQDSVIYHITPHKGMCDGVTKDFVVHVQPFPDLTTAPLSKAICDSTGTNIILQSRLAVTNFTWTCSPSSGNVTGYSDNTTTPGTLINQVLYNSGYNFETVTYHILPRAYGCFGDTTNFIVTVKPEPDLSNNPKNIYICSRSWTNVTLTSNVPTTKFTWSCTAGANVTGWAANAVPTNLLNQFLINNGTTLDSVVYHLVPKANNCDGKTTDFKVYVYPLPVPVITGSNSVCFGSQHTYSTQPGMSNYNWTVSGGIIIGPSDMSDVTIEWNALGVQSVSVTYTDLSGCSPLSATVYNVTVNPSPVPTITGPASVCLNSSIIYTTEAGMTNYLWTVTGGTITAGNNTFQITVNWTTTGPQDITVNYNNANNCTAPSPTTKNLTVHPLPVPTVAGLNSVCQNSTHPYTSEPGMSNYLWTVSGGAIISGGGTNAIQVQWTTTGTQTITINYQDVNGCTAQSPTDYSVTVNPLPVPSITGPNSICAGFTAVYSTEAGKTNYTWLVSPGGTLLSGGGTDSITVQWNTVGAQTISVNYFDGNLCTAANPTIYPVTVNPLPVPTITGNISVCNNTSHNYSTEPGMTGYTWIVPPGGTITAGAGTNSITVLWSIAGTYVISVNYTNSFTCTAVSPTTLSVTVHALPVPTISGPGAMCLNNTGTYSTEGSMSNYLWTVTGGTITSGAGTNTVQVNWTSIGTQTLTVTYTDGNSCNPSAPTSYSVTINTLPVPTITGPAAECVGLTSVYTTEAGMASYTWSVTAGGNIIAGGGTNSITILWNTVGAQTVSVNYVVGTGCTAASPTNKNITINALPTPTISGSNVVCQNTTHIYSTEPGMTGYVWTVPPAGNITAGSGTNAITVQWNSPGSFTISVNYINANNCTAVNPTNYNITINPAPVPTITGPAANCITHTSSYITEAGMSNYQWTVTGGTVVSGTGTNTVNVLWNTLGAQTMTINYTDINGCVPLMVTSKSIAVNPLPSPVITGNNSVCEQQTGVNYSTPDVIGHNYNWSVNGGAITSGSGTNAITVTWGPAGIGKVRVIETIQATGCSDSASYNITINPRPTPVISGLNSICEFSTQSYSTPNIIGHSYNWNLTGGAIQSGQGTFQIQVLWGAAGIGTINVQETILATGCSANATAFGVTINPYPLAAGPITGSNAICEASNNVVYSVPPILYATSYIWTYSGTGVTITNNGSSISVNFAAGATSGILTVKGMNNCGPGSSSVLAVTVNPLPIVSLTPCNDQVTTTNSQPFRLKGGIPIGGVYSGTGVSAGIFSPGLAGPGMHVITYTYTNTWGCISSNNLNINVLSTAAFACGNNITDVRDNQQYPTVQISGQCWMAANLNYGNTILSSSVQRDNCVPEKYCFTDTPANCTTKGGLYQWDELMQFTNVSSAQGLCLPGWHIPSENDWNILFLNWGSNGFAGSPLKFDGFTGFLAYLWGARFENSTFSYSGFATFFWTSTMDGPNKAWAHGMNTIDPSVSSYPNSRSNAYFVRCIKD